VVIAGSILLAFAIDAGWDARQERLVESQYLESLVTELSASRAEIDDDLGFRRDVLARIDELLPVFDGVREAPNRDSVLQTLGGLRYQKKFAPPRAVLDEIVSAGVSRLIRSETVRRGLMRYSQELEKSRIEEQDERDFIADQFSPYLLSRVSLREAEMLAMFSGQQTILRTPELGRPGSPIPQEIWSHIEFENLLIVRREKAAVLVSRHEGIGQLIDSLSLEIERNARPR
jgi:hypothetical protein